MQGSHLGGKIIKQLRHIKEVEQSRTMLAFTVVEGDAESDLFSPDVHSRISFPTCEDLGIPRDQGMTSSYDAVDISVKPPVDKSVSSENSAFRINGLQYDNSDPKNPFSPFCRIPLPSPLGGYEYGIQPAFIRKRNERERERVRCVNEGYAKLREHLPLENKEKRISKVETLRGAIRYIKHLQGLLRGVESQKQGVDEQKTSHFRKRALALVDCETVEDSSVKRLCIYDSADSVVDTDSD